jgi:periplasmic copper chaperone A
VRRTLFLSVVLVLLSAAPALAHVTVTPKEAAKGATVNFTFAVPNEKSDASTTAVEIVFPRGVTFATIEAPEKPGWTFQRMPGQSPVNSPSSPVPPAGSVKWSGGSISGEDRETFAVTLGPMPNDTTLVFSALQTYSDGEVVRWIGEASSDNPAPVVALTGDPVPVATTTPMTSPTPSVEKPDIEADSGLGTGPIVFGALVLAGIGAGLALAMRRRPTQP